MKSKVLLILIMVSLLLSGQAMAREAESGSGSGGSRSSSSDDSSRSRSSDDSGSGMEVETEHGTTFLKPHGGSSSSSSSLRSSSSSSRSSGSGMEVETEHGITFLKAHSSGRSRDIKLENRVKGRILLQVQRNGEAWFVEPTKNKVVFLGRPDDALRVMREFGLGIKDADLNKIKIAGQSGTSDAKLSKRLGGKIVLQVEKNGEAWYIDPVTHQRHFLGRPADALNLMRSIGIGITDENLAKLSALK